MAVSRSRAATARGPTADQRPCRVHVRALFDKCFRVKGRTTSYLEPEEIQRGLVRFLAYRNLERSQQVYRLKGRTPAQALREALRIEELPPIVPTEEEATMPAA